jgi:hypothetical protein
LKRSGPDISIDFSDLAGSSWNKDAPIIFPIEEAALYAPSTTLFFVDPPVLAEIHATISGLAP